MENSDSKPKKIYGSQQPKGYIPKDFIARGYMISSSSMLRRWNLIGLKATNLNSYSPKEVNILCKEFGEPDWKIVNELMNNKIK